MTAKRRYTVHVTWHFESNADIEVLATSRKEAIALVTGQVQDGEFGAERGNLFPTETTYLANPDENDAYGETAAERDARTASDRELAGERMRR